MYREKELWDIFSKFIRLRDSDDNGYCSCISCGKTEPWKYQEAGHYTSRTNAMLKFDEINVNSQCVMCNRYKNGNPEGYKKGLIVKYGEDVLRVLEIRKGFYRLSHSEIDEKINYYKKRVKEMKLDKGFK